MFRVMIAENKFTEGHQVSRKETSESAFRSAAYFKGRNKDSVIWIDVVHTYPMPNGRKFENYERYLTYYDGSH